MGPCFLGGLRQKVFVSCHRKTPDHIGAAGRRRHLGEHCVLHLQGRGQPQTRDHLAAEQVSWASGALPAEPPHPPRALLSPLPRPRVGWENPHLPTPSAFLLEASVGPGDGSRHRPGHRQPLPPTLGRRLCWRVARHPRVRTWGQDPGGPVGSPLAFSRWKCGAWSPGPLPLECGDRPQYMRVLLPGTLPLGGAVHGDHEHPCSARRESEVPSSARVWRGDEAWAGAMGVGGPRPWVEWPVAWDRRVIAPVLRPPLA